MNTNGSHRENLTNGRFPDGDETTRETRQNKDMQCLEIPSGNHGMVK